MNNPLNSTSMQRDPASRQLTPAAAKAERITLVRRGLTGLALAWLMAAALGPRPAAAQATPNPPGQVSYQGFLTDANGGPLATNAPKNYDVTFRIYNSPNSATPLWGELQTVTVDHGYFSVLLGAGSAVSGVPNTNNLTSLFTGPNASDRYIGITVAGLSQTPTEIQPRMRLLASPYAFLAANANALVANTGAQVVTTTGTSVGINQTPNPNDSLTINGTLGLSGASVLQFGDGVAGREPNAGKIGYQTFSSGLDIIGAGTTGANRRIKLWGEGGVTTTGPVGINTDSPASELHVLSTSGDSEISIQSGDSGNHRWTLQSSGGAVGSQLGGTFQIIDRTVGASRMVIDTHGNVGLGVVPSATLHVSGNTYLDGYAGVSGANVLEFGRGVAGKEGNAGKIGYKAFDSALDIVGAGTGANRVISLIAEGGTTATGPLVAYGQISAPSVSLGFAVNEGVLSLGGSQHMNDNPIYFRGSIDHNHWIGYANSAYSPYNFGVDGPAVVGCNGGLLGTTCGTSTPQIALRWDNNGYCYVRGFMFAPGFLVSSDRNVKEQIEDLDGQSVLAKISAMPIQKWSFTNSPTARHIGPMAQDFHDAFGLNDQDDTHISLGDEVGVTLAAVKALNETVQQKDTEIKTLQKEVSELRAMVEGLAKVQKATQ